MGWIKAQDLVSHVRLLVLGGYGTGKSYFAATAPEPIFLMDFDKGAVGYAGRKVYVPDVFFQSDIRATVLWNSVEQELDAILKGNHPAGEFKTIVLDSLTTATSLALKMSLEKRPAPPDSPPVWNIHYPMAKVFLDRLFDKLKKAGCHVIVIGHIEYDKDETTGEILASPAVTGKLKAYIPALFDEVYFSDIIQTKEGPQYILRLGPQGFKRARSRLRTIAPSIPESIPNNWEALWGHIEPVLKGEKV